MVNELGVRYEMKVGEQVELLPTPYTRILEVDRKVGVIRKLLLEEDPPQLLVEVDGSGLYFFLTEEVRCVTKKDS